MKKLLTFLLSIVILLSMVACAASSTHTNDATTGSNETIEPSIVNPTEPTEQGTTEPTAIPSIDDPNVITIGIPQNASVIDYETNVYTLWLEQQTGYKLDFIHFAYPVNDYVKQLRTALINLSEPLPDILLGFDGIEKNEWQIYGQDGYFVDLTEYFLDKEGMAKTWWDRVTEFDAETIDTILRYVTADDNRIYSFPTVQYSEGYSPVFMPLINTQWLENLNLPMPHDIESFYNTLIAFRDNDPNKNNIRDDYPIIGTKETVDWLINMFVYFDSEALFALSENGEEIVTPFTTDSYRNSLIFIKRLIDQGLLNYDVFTKTDEDIIAMLNPSSGTSNVGVLVGNPTQLFQQGNETLFEYAAMPIWGYAQTAPLSVKCGAFITKDADNIDACWELLMLMTSEEASLRQYYGVLGTDWTWADENTLSVFGNPAKVKVINDLTGQTQNSNWSDLYATILIGLNGENAQITNENEWYAYQNQLSADIFIAYKNAGLGSPKYILPQIFYDREEYNLTEDVREHTRNTIVTCTDAFITGINSMNITDNTHWNVYIDMLNANGLSTWISQLQRMYVDDGYRDIVK